MENKPWSGVEPEGEIGYKSHDDPVKSFRILWRIISIAFLYLARSSHIAEEQLRSYHILGELCSA